MQGAAGTDQPALGHCCVGTNASDNTPSCAMGCLIGRHTADRSQCQETCIRAQYGARRGQCEFRSAETGNLTLNMCSSCVSGVPGDCRSRFGPTINQTSTCMSQDTLPSPFPIGSLSKYYYSHCTVSQDGRKVTP